MHAWTAEGRERARDEEAAERRRPEPAILALQRGAGNAAVARLLAGRRIVARQGPTIGSTASVTGALQPDAALPEVQSLLQELTALAVPNQRTRLQLTLVRQRLDNLPPRIQLKHAAVLQRLADAVALELQGLTTTLSSGNRPATINDAQGLYTATNNCALTTIGALTGEAAGTVAQAALPQGRADDKVFSSYETAGPDKPKWDKRLQDARAAQEHPEVEEQTVLADAQFEGMQRYLRGVIAARDLPLEVTASDKASLAQTKAAMLNFPVGTQFAFKYHGHWNFAALTEGGSLVFQDFQQDCVPLLTSPRVRHDPKALTGSDKPILAMNNDNDAADMLDMLKGMDVFMFIAVAPSLERRARVFKFPDWGRLRTIKDNATTKGKHGQLSVSKYTKKARDFDDYIAAAKWDKARKEATEIFERLQEMNEKKNYWVSDQLKTTYFSAFFREATEVKLRAERAAKG